MYCMNIYLIGYMGSGKSTVGRLLAAKLQLEFIDFDEHIELSTEKTITEIFDQEGEEKFRALEHECLKRLLTKNNVVIALGGGTPCFHNNMELINKKGTSVYIDMNVADLVKRLAKARNKRPLIRDLNEVDLKYFVEANLEKRLPVYKQAHHTIHAGNLPTEKLAEIIWESVKRG